MRVVDTRMRSLLLILVAVSGMTTLACSLECPFSPGDITDRISFLSQHQSSERDDCIDEALRGIRDYLPKTKLTEEQTVVLVGFLDHKRILSEAEQQGFQIHFPTKSELYPAIGDL